MNRPEDQVLVIFGASGDLTKRMLMPSLYELHVRQRFVILGTSRKSMSDEEFRLSIRLMLEELKGEKGLDGEEVDRFLQKVFYQPFDPVEGADELGERVMFLMEENAIPMQVVYYLATPPNSQQAITKYIGRSCLFGVKERGGWHRIVVEKPFGTSLETAKELDKSLLQVFCEQEIYRIDHFLGKETVQNILVLRFCERNIRIPVESELRGLRGNICLGIARDRESGEVLRDSGGFTGYGAEPFDAVVGFRGYGIPGDDGARSDSGRDGEGVTFASAVERGGYSP